MSEEEHQDALKVMRAFNENRDFSSRGRGGRGRGNRTALRLKADKSEAEADIAENTSGGVSCFNAEITGEISVCKLPPPYPPPGPPPPWCVPLWRG